jgi:ABC-type sugar transport system substrate-binding protein
MSKQLKLFVLLTALLALVIVPAVAAQDATEEPMMEEEMMMGRELGEQEQAIADAIAECSTDQELTIMTSLPDLAFPFFVHMQSQLSAEAEAIGGITIIESDGQDDSAKQSSDVENAVIQGVDAIVISPKDVNALAPAIQEAIDAGVPVVTIDRFVEDVDGLVAHVGAENVLGGEAQGNIILEMFPDGATVVNLQGQPGAGPAIARNEGLHNILDGMEDTYPIVAEQTANFRRDEGLQVMQDILTTMQDDPPNVVVAANDDMALGAMQAVDEAGLTGEIVILGFDALPEALAAVQGGTLTGTVEQFPGGQSATAMRVAALNARGCMEFPADDEGGAFTVFLTPVMVTNDNFDLAERTGEIE